MSGSEVTSHPAAVVRSLVRLSGEGVRDETTTWRAAGHDVAVYVRSRDVTAPVLLFVHGGPGTPLSATAWMWQRPLEDFFTVVHYDQRGSGRTTRLAGAAHDSSLLTVDAMTGELLEVAAETRRQFPDCPLILVGHSWGTVLSVRAVLKDPSMFDGYVGVGQVVNFLEGERIGTEMTLERACGESLPDLEAVVNDIRSHPRLPLTLETMASQRSVVARTGGYAAGRGDCDYFNHGALLSPWWDQQDREAADEGNLRSAQTLLPQVASIDFSDLTSFPIPIMAILGRFDAMTPSAPVARWIDTMKAPLSLYHWFERSAHMPMFEESGRFLMALHDFDASLRARATR